MMTFTTGNLLDAKVEALVNTVNTVGVMGRGIALMFKEAFPENTSLYEKACKNRAVHVGSMFVVKRDSLLGPKWIINFPTKEHWKDPSKISWIKDGLQDLKGSFTKTGSPQLPFPHLVAGTEA